MLVSSENVWPCEKAQVIETPELRKNICLATTFNLSIFEKYSSYSKLCRIVAYCLRFRPVNKHHGSLCAKEIDEAEIRVIKFLQASRFTSEIEDLENKPSTYKDKLVNLSPFLDKNGLIRVGGRLQSSNLTFSQKHPMLLLSRDQITDRIIRKTHERYHHAGI